MYVINVSRFLKSFNQLTDAGFSKCNRNHVKNCSFSDFVRSQIHYAFPACFCMFQNFSSSVGLENPCDATTYLYCMMATSGFR